MVRNLTHSLRAETSKHSFKSPGCDGSTLDSNCNKYAVMAATYAVLNWIEQLNHMLMVVNNKKSCDLWYFTILAPGRHIHRCLSHSPWIENVHTGSWIPVVGQRTEQTGQICHQSGHG